MHLTNSHFHAWTVAAAVAIAFLAFMLPKPAGAQAQGTQNPSRGFYTTTSSSTSTSSTDTAGVTTTTTNTSTNTPRGVYGTGSNRGDRRADYWRNDRGGDRNWRDSGHTSDLDARYPYDDTNGRNRSDLDAARTGFDDPRNPWDGRYANDHPSNAVNSNDRVNALRGNEVSRNLGNDRYRPGNYGTRRVGR